MKSKYKILAFLMAAIGFVACEENFDEVVISDQPTAPSLISPAQGGLEFIKDNADDTLTFEWTAADLGFSSASSYFVQLSTDEAFTDPATIVTTNDLSADLKVSDINGTLLSMDLPVDVQSTVYARVYSAVVPDVDTLYSDVKSYTVTPYETLIDYPMYYVPGAYQGWSPGAEEGRLYSYEFNDIYENIILFDGSDPVEFKITPAPNWDNSWGGTLTATANGYSGTLDPSGGNYSVPAGLYKVVVDAANLTIELSNPVVWGVIGSAIPPYGDAGWAQDQDMTYDGQRRIWTWTGDLEVGEMKFRANDSWDLNYGDSGADGSLDAGGDNIQVTEAGNYTVTLDLVNNTYSLQLN
ncbi:SusE domain-containing protein [Mangrovivirga sp. M17]|uniref:SusE domain-containing protein n=1 Tax=Mangrovivirga halotolerans TaxID=2993936 RepID=A0ABT3RV68_9BACT|nr:SusE domain-containing protein [Mangrovivirga halotolerans]MCX2745661.1 SusE domain-containing protein [Mangrovivirga halotolerans]